MSKMERKLPEGWEWSPLCEVVDFVGGSQPPKSKFSTEKKEGYVRLIQIRDYKSDKHIVYIPKNSTKKFCTTEDIMIGRYGPPVFQILKGLEGAYNVALMKAIPDEKIIEKDFLFWFLKSPEIQNYIISISQRAAGQSGVNKKALEKFQIPLPPLREQKRIVQKLDTLFQEIEAAKQLVEENLATLPLLKKSWLQQAFEGQLLGKSAVDEKGLPLGWEKNPLCEVVSFVGGSQPPKLKFSTEKKEGYVRLIQIRDYKSDKHIVYIPEHSTKKFCTVEDIMIGRYGPPVFQILRGLEGAYNVALMKAIPDDKIMGKDFLFWFLKSPKIQNYIISISQRAAGQSGVNKKALEKFQIPIPPMEDQKALVKKLDQLFQEAHQLEEQQQAQLEELEQLKKSLLEQAFRGAL